MEQQEESKRITIRVLALGFTAAFGIMQLSMAKDSLDFKVYGHSIELYGVVKAIIFLGMIGFGIITGGTFLVSMVKGNGRN